VGEVVWETRRAIYRRPPRMLLIVGSIIVTASVIGGYLMAGGPLLVLLQPAELVIIGGAAIGGLVIGTPMPVLKALGGQFSRFFKARSTKEDYLELLGMMYQMFKVTQQAGVMALESHVEDASKSPIMSKYPKFLANHHAVHFLTDSIKVIILGGIAPHDLEALMDEDLHVHHEEAIKPAQTLTKTSDALPGLGIVAAVLGIVVTMQAIDGPPQEIGHHVAAALVGTFLGILACYGFVGPAATSLEHIVNDEAHYLVCIKTGLLAVYKGFPPAIAVEFARRVLPGEVRPSFDETEQYCKGVGKQDAGQPAVAA
ncbi:MAG: flagellar motor stator protein MotA, partial [Acidobacteria bacterium]|nr:flagellar motor stator protein MotA [Acidobacteriota bacterium]